MQPELLADISFKWLGSKVIDTDKPFLLECALSVIDFIQTSCPNAPKNKDDTYSHSTIQAAKMLVAQLFMRRNSPNGIESITMEGVAYTAKYNPEVSRLLRIDGYKIPMIG